MYVLLKVETTLRLKVMCVYVICWPLSCLQLLFTAKYWVNNECTALFCSCYLWYLLWMVLLLICFRNWRGWILSWLTNEKSLKHWPVNFLTNMNTLNSEWKMYNFAVVHCFVMWLKYICHFGWYFHFCLFCQHIGLYKIALRSFRCLSL